MAYIPLIKKTKWIDLSNEHKRLREEVEKDLREGCCENGNIQPIMLQGAFGIGKTNTLYYIFHYCWEVLKTPALYMPLAKIVDEVKKEAKASDSGKVENNRLSLILKKMIDEQIALLKTDNYDEVYNVDFPEFQSGDENVNLSLTDYLKDFESVNVVFEKKEENLFEDVVFDKDVISSAITSGNVPVLLVDEFESKFYELKKIVASSGGGILRELFDQIVQNHPFQLVIGNGPASGYEVAKDKGGEAESETAANRRLKTIPIPFPAASLLKRKFMLGCANGYVNFIWWMSRCRPGHVQKLYDNVKYDMLSGYKSSEFVTQSIFDEPIDEGGEEVTYLKTSYFETIDSHLFPIVKNLLLDFEPCELTMEKDYIDAFKYENDAKSFFCSDETINVEKVLCPALKDDLCIFLDKCKNSEAKYLDVNYYTHLNKYFSYILDACANKDGEIAFNSPYKYAEEALADSFLIPMLELTYDFVSQYEDSEAPAIKEVRDFLLDCIKHVERSKEEEQIAGDFPELSNLFDGFRANKCKGDEVYIQFSLRALREIFEQPIGSPILRYRGMSLEEKLETVDFQKTVLLTDSYDNHMIVFVPNLEEDKQDAYLSRLENFIESIKNDLHENAQITLHVVYLQESEKIDSLKTRITRTGEELLPIAKYKKIVFELFDDYKFNFGRQIQDFIDSVAKIVIAGCACGDLYSTNGMTCEVRDVITKIKDSSWTPQKEIRRIRRTIEHYEKLVCEGDNAILRAIKSKSLIDYEDALTKAICDASDYEDNIPCDFTKIVDGKVTDTRSKYLAQLYAFEKAGKSGTSKNSLVELLKKIGTQGSLYFAPNEDKTLQTLHFDQLKTALSDSEELSVIFEKYNRGDRFIQNLFAFAGSMVKETVATDIETLYAFMNDSIDNHWIGTYSDKLKYNCSKAETLIKLLYLSNYVSKMDNVTLKESLISNLNAKGAELNATRVSLTDSINEILTLLYTQKPPRDNESQPFFGYLHKLSEVGRLFDDCQRVLREESGSIAALCIIYSVYSRLVDIVGSIKILSTQTTTIKNSLSSFQQSVNRLYQLPINEIYENKLAAKLINMKSPDASKNGFRGYDEDYCWANTRNTLKYHKDETKNVFTTKLNPIKNDTLKASDVSAFTNYLSRVLQSSTDIKNRLDSVINLCRECKVLADDYTELKTQIENLLKVEVNNG
ncbi:hypothetical protein [Pseudobutyrivibrio sp.]